MLNWLRAATEWIDEALVCGVASTTTSRVRRFAKLERQSLRCGVTTSCRPGGLFDPAEVVARVSSLCAVEVLQNHLACFWSST